MGKIVIHYEKHNKTFWQKYWGLILLPLFPIWLLTADDGNAGWLDVDGRSYKLKYRKNHHPQVIQVPAGRHEICYRKKSKLAIAFMESTQQTSGGFGLDLATAMVDRMGGYDDYKLESCVLDFGPATTLTLGAVGGIAKELTVLDLSNTPGRSDAPLPDTYDDGQSTSSGGCLKAAIIGLLALLVILGSAYYILLTLTGPSDSSKHASVDPVYTTSSRTRSTTQEREDYVTTTTEPTTANQTVYVGAPDGLPLHNHPRSTSGIYLIIPHRSKLVVVERRDNWAKVCYQGIYGWCNGDGLFDSANAAATANGTFFTTTTTTTTTTVPPTYDPTIGIPILPTNTTSPTDTTEPTHESTSPTPPTISPSTTTASSTAPTDENSDIPNE